MIYRITNKKNSILKSKKPTQRSYFIDRVKLFEVKDFENPW